MKRFTLSLLGTLVCAAPALAGEFYQFDTGPAGHSAVAVKAWDDLKITGAHSRWSKEGRATSAALMQTLPLDLGLPTLKLSLGVQAIDHRSAPEAASPSDSGVGLKLGAEWQPRVGPGQGYLLLERASVFGSWLAVAQYKPDALPVGIEWAAAGDDRWYVGRSLALRYAVPGTRWSTRLGYRQNDQRFFVGVSYNSF